MILCLYYNQDLIGKIISIIIIFYLIVIIHPDNYDYDKLYQILPKTNLNRNISYKNLTDIFESRLLYIDKTNLTKEYIHFIRPLKGKKMKRNKSRDSKQVFYNFKNRTDKLKYKEFIKICDSERLIYTNISKSDKNPIISVILPSFNKEKVLMKSVRSIQNQSLKNIEIIIVDDCSSDNSTKYYKYLIRNRFKDKSIYSLKKYGSMAKQNRWISIF